MKTALSALLLLIVLTANAQHHSMIVKKDALKQLKKFKSENKFAVETSEDYYQGLSNVTLQAKMNTLLNNVADNFMLTVNSHPTEEEFQKNIQAGLASISPYYLELDTEDREKTCRYFEQLMDCVGLESSNGQLNKWMYGFDPNKKQ